MKEVFRSALTDVTSDLRDTLGDFRCEQSKWYKYVKLYNTTATVAGAAGDPVAYDSETGAEDNTVVIDLSDADNPPVCAGFLLATVTGTLLTAYYVWIQLTGPLTCVAAITNGADGVPATLSTTDKTLTVALASGTNAVQHCCMVNDASAKKIIANCLF